MNLFVYRLELVIYLRTVCVTSVLAHCTVIHSDHRVYSLLLIRPLCYISYNPSYRNISLLLLIRSEGYNVLHRLYLLLESMQPRYFVPQMPLLSPVITPADKVPVPYSNINLPVVTCNHSC